MKAPPATGSNTLDEMIALNLVGYGHCPVCGRSVKFDLPALRDAHGGDKRLSNLVKRMKCRACGHLGVEVTIAGR